MRKLFTFSVISAILGMGAVIVNGRPYSSTLGGPVVLVSEEDGDPVSRLRILTFPNGSLTDNGGGDISFAGSAADAVEIAASTTALQALIDSNLAALAQVGIDTDTLKGLIDNNATELIAVGVSTEALQAAIDAINFDSVFAAVGLSTQTNADNILTNAVDISTTGVAVEVNTSAINGKVAKAGDTMTGELIGTTITLSGEFEAGSSITIQGDDADTVQIFFRGANTPSQVNIVSFGGKSAADFIGYLHGNTVNREFGFPVSFSEDLTEGFIAVQARAGGTTGKPTFIIEASTRTTAVDGAGNQTTIFLCEKEDDGEAQCGIGKTPTTALDVLGTVTADAFAGPLTGAASDNVLKAGDTMTGNLDVTGNISVSNVYFSSGTGDNVMLGKLGIGTNDPQGVLDIEGAAHIGDATTKSTFTAAGALLTHLGITVGTEGGGSQKIIVAASDATGGDEGGEIQLMMADDHDVSINSWVIDVFEDDLRIFPEGGNAILITINGGLRLRERNKAELEAIVSVVGEIYGCSNCDNNVNVVKGTGTLSGFDSFGIGGTLWH